MDKTVETVIVGIFAALSLIISVLQFKEKGFVFNNAYVFASKRERETMNKKPYYRQSAIVFALIFAMFFCIFLECILSSGWIWMVGTAFAAAAIIYAIVSSMKKISE